MLVPVLQFVNRVWPLALAAVFFLPLWSVWARGDVSWGQKIVLAGVLGVSAVSPFAGVVAMAVLLPLALGVATLTHGLTATHVTECLALAFASGACLRAGRSTPGGGGHLGHPALVLGAAIATSAIVDLAAVRAVTPGRPFFAELWEHVHAGYWGEGAVGWRVLHDAVRWLAVLAIAVCTERAVRPRAEGRSRVVWLWIACGAAATTFTVRRVVEIVARRDEPWTESIAWLIGNHRLSVLHPDPNAAGSLFALLLVAAVLIGLGRRAWWMLGGAVPLLLVGLGLAQSRAAIGAVVIVLIARWLTDRVRTKRVVLPVAVVAVVVVALAGTWMVSSRTHVSPTGALGLRLEMAQVGWRMVQRFPLFGVGLSDYPRTSKRFTSPELQALTEFAPWGENAHNNFLQVLAELGLPAFLAFLWLFLPGAGAVWGRQPVSPEYRGIATGLCAFLVSALFGHPLLIPEVAAMCFFGLGLASAHRQSPQKPWRQALALAGVGFYMVSLTWRI